MRVTSLIMVVVIVLALAGGCTMLPPGGQGGVSVSDAFARSSPMEGGSAGAFMTIKNSGATADRLKAAEFAGAQATELHETIEENGVMKMVPHPEGWEVPAGGELVLKPGGKHVMLVGLKEPLKAGADIELKLVFDKAGPINLKVPVKEP